MQIMELTLLRQKSTGKCGLPAIFTGDAGQDLNACAHL